jgi:hypothetical protein
VAQSARPPTIAVHPGRQAAGFRDPRLIEPVDAVEYAMVMFHPEGYPLWYQFHALHRRRVHGRVAQARPSARRTHYVVEVLAPAHADEDSSSGAGGREAAPAGVAGETVRARPSA